MNYLSNYNFTFKVHQKCICPIVLSLCWLRFHIARCHSVSGLRRETTFVLEIHENIHIHFHIFCRQKYFCWKMSPGTLKPYKIFECVHVELCWREHESFLASFQNIVVSIVVTSRGIFYMQWTVFLQNHLCWGTPTVSQPTLVLLKLTTTHTLSRMITWNYCNLFFILQFTVLNNCCHYAGSVSLEFLYIYQLFFCRGLLLYQENGLIWNVYVTQKTSCFKFLHLAGEFSLVFYHFLHLNDIILTVFLKDSFFLLLVERKISSF